MTGTTHAQRALAAIEAVLEQRASSMDLEYTFEDGRSVKMLPPSELLRLRDYYKREVAREGGTGAGRRPIRLLSRL